MENKAHALAAGIFVVAMAALLVMLAAWLTRDTGIRDIYEISTRETVTGLQEQAAVRYRGVDVGKVDAIGFDPKVPGNVLIRMEVDREAPLTRDTFAMLSYQGVTGLAFVQLGDHGKAAPRLVPNDDAPPRIPLEPGLLAKLETRGEAIMANVESVTKKLDQLLAADNEKRIATAMDNVGQAAASVSTLSTRVTALLEAQFGPDRVNIPKFVADTGATVNSLRATSDEARGTLAEIRSTAKRLNAPDGPVDRLAEGTQALSHAGDQFNNATLPRVNRVAEETSRAARQLSRTVNNINDNPQSLIFGSGQVVPGPGEPGFTAPAAAGAGR